MNVTDFSISSDSISDLSQPPKVEIIDRSCEYDGFYKIDRLTVLQPKFDGSGCKKLTRYIFERGDAVAVLLHDPKLKKILLVRQFRLPAMIRDQNGWMLEIVAGSVKSNENPLEVAVREVNEETGCYVASPRYLLTFFLSPGASTERCHLYELDIDSSGLHSRLCGESGTDEDIRVEMFDLPEVIRMIKNGHIQDAKTIIAVQMLSMGLIQTW